MNYELFISKIVTLHEELQNQPTLPALWSWYHMLNTFNTFFNRKGEKKAVKFNW